MENLPAWLTTVVARISLNMLRSRNSRHEEPLDSQPSDQAINQERAVDPEQEAILADSVGLALLVMLDTLTPSERLAFVMHDMFDLPFDDIAPIVDRSPAAARQLATRAGRRVRGASPAADPSAREEDGEDHVADFRQLLQFLSRDDDAYMKSLGNALDERRKQLMGQDAAEAVTERLESALKQYMCDVRASDISSFKAMSGVFKAARTGNPMEYWKSVPMFAHFVTDYKIGRVLSGCNYGDLETIRPLLPTLTTIDPEAYRNFGSVETDNAKFRALRKHTTGQDWWKLLWMPPSFPYLEAATPYAEVGIEVTKQLVFSAWNASPNALSTLLSYEAQRHILQNLRHGQNTADERKRFSSRLQCRIRREDGEAQSMLTLAMFIPHAALAPLADLLRVATR